MMMLYACGFNAWNQLLLGENKEEEEEEPHDLWLFRKVLEDENINIRRVDFSSVLVEISSGLLLSGMPDTLAKGMRGTPLYHALALAGNGKIAVTNHLENSPKIEEFNSWLDYPDHPAREWDIGKVKQLVAGRTTFTALLETGDVWAWGDIRYSACLGRDVSLIASNPGQVSDLTSLPTGPIVRIASGGFVTAALTAGNDLYAWGIDEIIGLNGQPAPLDIGNADIVDVGVGDGHVIVLTTDERVLVIGKGQNGQLGMGAGMEELREWREVDLELGEGWTPLRVVAGPRCSFVLVSDC